MRKPTRQELNSKKNRRKRLKVDKKQHKKARRWFVKLPLFLLKFTVTTVVIGLLAGIGGGIWFWQSYGGDISSNIAEGYQIAKTIDERHFEKTEPTQLVDANGKLIREFKERNFHYLDIQTDDALFEKVSDAVVSIEDERFYLHEGFDYYGVGVSVFHYLNGGSLRGASTITQQVVKNTYLTQQQTFDRKIQEAVIAQELENVFSKREILEFYVNGNYYANGQYGLETAARYYYSKSTAELTAGELALLTGIPNNPTTFDPIKQPDNARQKRDVILAKMQALGKLSAKDYAEEKAKDLNLNITKTSVNNAVNDYGESYALHHAVERLMEYGGFELTYWFESKEEKATYQTTYGERYVQVREDVLRGGYKIQTSIDPAQQAILQKAVDDQMAQYRGTNPDTGLYTKQASAVTIDHQTNEVVAIVGGRSQEGNTYNRAYLAARQPASAIKPFVVYAPAFEQGYFPQSVMVDKALENGPGNWYDGYRGNMTLRYAMEQSVNTVAHQLLGKIGVQSGLNPMTDMRFTHLDPDDSYLSIAIGGFTYGTTPVDLASGLSTLVNGGQYTRPSNVRKVSHLHTDETYYDKSEEDSVSVYTPEASYMTLDIMKDVVKSGSGKTADFGHPHLAGKTGSSNDRKDQWFIGTTANYGTAVWVGEDQPKAQPFDVSLTPMAIFKQAMTDFHKGVAVKDFTKPTNVQRQANGAFTVQNKHVQTKNPLQVAREKEEQQRVAQESKTLKQRLNDLDYRLVHGLSWEEEKAREQYAQSRIHAMTQVELTELEDFMAVESHYEEVKTAIKQVKRQSAKEQITQEAGQAYDQKRVDRDALLQAMREKERLRVEEAKRQEEAQAKEKQREADALNKVLEQALEEKNRAEEAELNDQFREQAEDETVVEPEPDLEVDSENDSEDEPSTTEKTDSDESE